MQRQYDPRLGINPPTQWKNRQQRQFNWMPLEDEDGNPYPWAINGKLDPTFRQWLAHRWMERFGSKDIFQAGADVLSYLINNPHRLEVKWLEYQEYMQKRVENIQSRLQSGGNISDTEKAEIVQHRRALTESLPPSSSLYALAPEPVALHPQLAPTIKPMELPPVESRQLNIMSELAQLTEAKSLKKVEPPKPVDEMAELNEWLADPILRPEVARKALKLYECELNAQGEPIRTIARRNSEELQALEQIENVD